MFNFRIATLNSILASSDVLAAWEIAAFFIGEAAVEILPIDEEEARIHFIESYVAEAERADYYAEPHLADAEMMENFAASLLNNVQSRMDELGGHYPFIINDHNYLIKKSDEEVSLVGLCYLALQFFRGLAGSTLEIEGESDEEVARSRNEFDKKFRSIFEYIAGYMVSGKNDGPVYMTSNCRSSVRLEKLLGSVCRKIGAGEVTPHTYWNPKQKAANDGGVDCLVHIGGPGAPGHAELALVGATVQKSNIDQKIIGLDERNFFRSFFSTQPAAFKGVLVRIHDEDALTKDKCAQKDCQLYTYEQIWRSMGKRNGGHYQTSSLIRLDAKVRKLFREFSTAVFLHEYDAFRVST